MSTPYVVRSGSIEWAYVEAESVDEAVAQVIRERRPAELGPSIEVLPYGGVPQVLETGDTLERLGLERRTA